MKKVRIFGLAIAIMVAIQMPMTTWATTVSGNAIVSENTLPEEETTDAEKEAVRDALLRIIEQKPIYVLLYNTASYELKSEADVNAAGVVNIVSGTQLEICDVVFAKDGQVFYLVSCGVNGNTYRGYVEGSYIVTNDTEFNQWKDEELIKVTGAVLAMEASNLESIYLNFPSGYWAGLTKLSQSHPNWVFVPFNTGLEWSEVLAAEQVGNRSLVNASSPDTWKSKAAGDYDPATGQYVPKSGSNWFRASEFGVSHCLNPLNYLNENNIFAFEQLTYNQSIHNAQGVDAIISGTWMSGTALEDGSGGLYKDVFVEIGQRSGVSPYHLASRVRQEQGIYGRAKLISGEYGVYNYFNVKASGGTEAAIVANGVAYAREQGWTTRYSSILGGANIIAGNYVSKGQDSLYLQKYDVDGSYFGLYSHQYMQNIQAPMTESLSVKRAYQSAGALDNNYVFKIPVYNNMPGASDATAEFPVSEEFITQLYSSILGRKPDAEGLEYWKNRMRSGSTAADLVVGFFDSQEMNNRNLSDAEYLQYAYTAILGRKPDASGKQYWLKEMAAGCTRKYILTGFVESTEFTNMCNEFGIVKGSITALAPADKNAGMTKFVVRLYRNIFGREADQGGLNDWTNRLQNGMTGCQLVEGFVYSKEFAISDFSNEEYVEILYRTLLGRDSEPAGKLDWVTRLENGESRSEVLAGFAYSTEFNNLCNEYGIKVGVLTK